MNEKEEMTEAGAEEILKKADMYAELAYVHLKQDPEHKGFLPHTNFDLHEACYAKGYLKRVGQEKGELKVVDKGNRTIAAGITNKVESARFEDISYLTIADLIDEITDALNNKDKEAQELIKAKTEQLEEARREIKGLRKHHIPTSEIESELVAKDIYNGDEEHKRLHIFRLTEQLKDEIKCRKYNREEDKAQIKDLKELIKAKTEYAHKLYRELKEEREKVKGLVDALRLAPCRCDPPSDNTCDRCVTLIKWGKGR